MDNFKFIFGVFLSIMGVAFFGREYMYIGNIAFIVGLGLSVHCGKI